MIERHQGLDKNGRIFGYDYQRKNFITWGIKDEKIVVIGIENDDQVEKHGSIEATLRDAKKIAAEENRLPNSRLKNSILMKFEHP